ncbi:hypothetical protein [Acidocella facilis]|uniref:hypothetical protein n=1 Tax=Acidocella facilis TaxID=525 RepID=UPI001F48E09C|nr:hypothetical protein [Acidocella facilis]
MKFALAAAISLFAIQAHAAQPTLTIPGNATPPVLDQNGSFIYGAGDEGWKFMMGPVREPNEVALAYSPPSGGQGGISLGCRAGDDGSKAMVVVSPNSKLPKVATTQKVSITVDSETHNLEMVVNRNGTGLAAQGPAAVAMLNRIATLPQGFTGNISVQMSGEIIANVPIGINHTNLAQADKVCMGWVSEAKDKN